MSVEFCTICGDVLEIVPMTIQGKVYDFWVCPSGDWEAPASLEAELALSKKDEESI